MYEDQLEESTGWHHSLQGQFIIKFTQLVQQEIYID